MWTPQIAKEVEHALRGLRYGSVQLVIHDEKVVRIERIERIRLTDSPEAFPEIPGRPTSATEARRHDHAW